MGNCPGGNCPGGSHPMGNVLTGSDLITSTAYSNSEDQKLSYKNK